MVLAPWSARAQTQGQAPPGVPLAPAYGRGGAAVAELVAGLGSTMRVLMIGAHPDDEDTRLLTWLARGQHVDTAYLSLTRGDGGQNLIGNELGDALGVIRTEELLAARRIDGAHQFFTRAYDFGFSKTAAESYSHWPHDSLLGDVVTIVRAFRPHVIVAVFSGTPRDGHGQHQVSGLLAREAYDASGDTVRFPVTRFGAPWTAFKFYRDRSYFGAGENSLAINVGAYDPLLGVTYSDIAAASRSQHKSQGFGNIGSSGPATAYLFREATRANSAVAPGHEQSMFDGIDTTWKRFVPFATESSVRTAIDSVQLLIGRIGGRFNASAPRGMSLAPLAQLWRNEFVILSGGRAVPDEATVGTSEPSVSAAHGAGQADMETTAAASLRRIERAMALASGLDVHATSAFDVAAVGSAGARVGTAVANHDAAPLHPRAVDWVTPTANAVVPAGAERVVSRDSTWRDTVVVHSADVTQPWWLREATDGRYVRGAGLANRRRRAAGRRVHAHHRDDVGRGEYLHRSPDLVDGHRAHWRPAARRGGPASRLRARDLADTRPHRRIRTRGIAYRPSGPGAPPVRRRLGARGHGVPATPTGAGRGQRPPRGGGSGARDAAGDVPDHGRPAAGTGDAARDRREQRGDIRGLGTSRSSTITSGRRSCTGPPCSP